jgi:hypothetical protein
MLFLPDFCLSGQWAAIYIQFMASLDDDFWPASLAHLKEPYLNNHSQYVTIGEISSEPVNNFPGTTLLYTAMVPAAEAEECLTRLGGMGHGMRHLPGQEVYDPASGIPLPSFWIHSGREDHKKYQPLVESWQVHDRHIILPFNGILQCYGLSPATISSPDDAITPTLVWHDLSRPTYAVVRVTPLAVYKVPKQINVARVEILREYLEDYLLANNCVALASQFEGRYSTGDPTFDSVVGTSNGHHTKLKGREIWLKRVEHIAAGDQYSDTWCTRLVMKPVKALDSDQTLVWPDHPKPIVGSGILTGEFGLMEEAYVRDKVLQQYEDGLEFEINPEAGYVSNGSWWSVGFCKRVGRDHIVLELRKLYENAQFPVVKHYCDFAVKEDSVSVPKNETEERNIGIRARELVEGYLALMDVIEQICDAAGELYTAEDIGGFSKSEINYQGWWTNRLLGRLGNVALRTMSYQEFLKRSKFIFAVFEGIKSAPLRTLLLKLQVPKKEVKSVEGIKLLAYLCQLATIAKNEGWGLIGDAELVAGKWDKDTRLDFFKPLFGLNGLRIIDAHASSFIGDPTAQAAQLKDFGIDSGQFKTDGGLALDRVYDEIIKSLRQITALLESIDLEG